MASKVDFALRVQGVMAQLGQASAALDVLGAVYVARGYAPAGADPITDADIASTGLTVAHLNDVIALATQYQRFLDNLSVTSGTYRLTINRLRNDL